MEKAPRKTRNVILSLVVTVTLVVSAVAVYQHFFATAGGKTPVYFG